MTPDEARQQWCDMLPAVAEWHDTLRRNLGMTSDDANKVHALRTRAMGASGVTFNDILNCDREWRQRLAEKEYHNVNIELETDPSNDKIVFSIRAYDEDWSSVDFPTELRKCSYKDIGTHLFNVTTWVHNLPHEAETRNQRLLRDYAAVKERIGKSNLSARVKSEAETLMKALSYNILPSPSMMTEVEVEQAASEGPDD